MKSSKSLLKDKLPKVLLIFVFVLVPNIHYAQNNYYVSTTGDDTNSGSFSSPWRTIQHGVNQLMPGDTLNIKAGTYEEKIEINVSGTPNAYITIKNYNNDNVVLDAINFSNSDAIIWTDRSYLRIIGLHLTNNIKNYATGFEIQGSAHDIEFINNKISNIRFSSQQNPTVTPSKNAVPLNIWGDNATDSIHNILIKGNEIFNNMTGYSENLTGGGNFTNFIFEDNIIHDNTNIGIDVTGHYGVCPNPALDQGRNGIIRNNIVYNCRAYYSTAAGIYVDGGKNIIIENNTSYQNGYGIEIGCEEDGTTDRVIVRNNLIYNNHDAGIAIGGYDSNTTGNVTNTKVYGNTFYKNDTEDNYNGEILLTQLDNCHITSNIFYPTNQSVLLEASRNQSNFEFNYNLIYQDNGTENIVVETPAGSYNTLSDYYNASGQGMQNIFGNPLFVAPLQGDFHIQSQSPAIDNGNPNLTIDPNEVDLDGQIRIDNNIIDCGVDEYYNNNGVKTTQNVSIKIYPNPAYNQIFIDNNIQNFSYKIFTLEGKKIAQGEAVDKILLFNISPGIYILKLTTESNNTFTKKILIK